MKKKVWVMLLSLVMILILGGCGKTEVSMKDYITVEYSGLNTIATAQSHFDDDAFIRAALGVEPVETDKLLTYLQNSMQLLAAVDYSVTPKTELKNGDKVSVSVTYDKEMLKQLKVSLKDTNWEFTVEGLQEGVVIDLFADLSIEYEGIDGMGRVASVVNLSEDSFLSSVTYTVEPRSNLKNGDAVTVSALCSEKDAHENGYFLEEMKAEYAVEGLGSYLTKVDQLTADMIQVCWDKAKAEMPSIGEETLPAKGYLLLYDESKRSEKSIIDYESIFVVAYQPANGFEPYESVTFFDLAISADETSLIDYYFNDTEASYEWRGAKMGGNTLEELKEEVESEYLSYSDKYILYEIDFSA